MKGKMETKPLTCDHCHLPVLPESMVKVDKFVFHWECVWQAGARGQEGVKHPRIFSMKSTWSGRVNEMVIWMTDEQFDELGREDHRHIQLILPEATPTEREFLISGMSAAEQKKVYGEEL